MAKQRVRIVTKKTIRKSKQNATVVKDNKGRSHCSRCGAYINGKV